MTRRPSDEILNDALDLEPGQRAAFIDAECGDDTELRQEIESLLAIHDAHPDVFQPVPIAPRFPERIGRYRVLREIGRGGMGVVFEAEDETLRRRVAVKVLPERLAGDAGWRERFEREAQTLAALNHPNIATIHSLEEAGGLHFLTMELVRGQSLAERLASGRLSSVETIEVGREIARALEAAHQQGITHCDLKPANIRVSEENHVKLIDFGIARSTADARQADDVLGTPGYMSPEQLRGLDVDHRADIWAYGCILYECLSGRRLFDADTLEGVVRATQEHAPGWDELPAETPTSVRLLLARCVEKDPQRRLSSIRLARADLEQLIALRSMPARSAAETAARRKHLPARFDRFVGRVKEREDVRRLLDEGRLVTLTGAGGSGKTRLALVVAEDTLASSSDAVAWVDLSAVTNADLVRESCAAALGVVEEPGSDLDAALAARVRDAALLIVLDNAEHLLEPCRELILRLLAVSPSLRFMVTSREALRLPGEVLYHVPTLPESESVDLFLTRARALVPDYGRDADVSPAVGRVCRQLDGIPLAIELAAARIKVLSLEEIERRISDRFQLLTAGSHDALPRHQTLKALVDWSYELMSGPERLLLRRLSVFAGGFGLDAAEAVGAGDSIARWEVLDLLSSLIDKSLVERDPEAGGVLRRPRYRMLETMRQYAFERLRESGEDGLMRRRHRDFFLGLAEEARPNMVGPGQKPWLERLAADHENLRAALETSHGELGDVEAGLRLVTALLYYWLIRGHWSEGSRFTDLFLDLAESGAFPAARAEALLQSANLCLYRRDFDRAAERCEEALEIGRARADPTIVVRALQNQGGIALQRASYDEATAILLECLRMAEGSGQRSAAALALNSLGVVEDRRGDMAAAERYYERGLAVYRELEDRYHAALLLNNLGGISLQQRDYALGEVRLRESLAMNRELEDRWGMAHTLSHLGSLSQLRGDPREALPLYHEALGYYRDLGYGHGVWTVVCGIGMSLVEDDPETGVRLLGAAERLRAELRIRLTDHDAREIEEARSAFLRVLSPSAFERAFTKGHALGTEEAADLALRAAHSPREVPGEDPDARAP